MSIQPPQNTEWKELESYDTGMGTNFENIRDNLLEEAQETAEELGLSYDPSEEEFEVYFSQEESKALDRKSTRLNSSHRSLSRMPSSA